MKAEDVKVGMEVVISTGKGYEDIQNKIGVVRCNGELNKMFHVVVSGKRHYLSSDVFEPIITPITPEEMKRQADILAKFMELSNTSIEINIDLNKPIAPDAASACLAVVEKFLRDNWDYDLEGKVTDVNEAIKNRIVKRVVELRFVKKGKDKILKTVLK